jgi:hypothetical protein
MTVVAEAIDLVSSRATCNAPFDNSDCTRIWYGSKRELALLLITKAWWESRLAQNVHEGNCKEWQCDAHKIGGRLVFRARTIWQMQKTSMVKDFEWEEMVGTDPRSTRLAAWVATRILAKGKNVCKTTQGTISYYATSRCEWNGAAKRQMFYEKLSKKTPEQLKLEAEERLAEIPVQAEPSLTVN